MGNFGEQAPTQYSYSDLNAQGHRLFIWKILKTSPKFPTMLYTQSWSSQRKDNHPSHLVNAGVQGLYLLPGLLHNVLVLPWTITVDTKMSINTLVS